MVDPADEGRGDVEGASDEPKTPRGLASAVAVTVAAVAQAVEALPVGDGVRGVVPRWPPPLAGVHPSLFFRLPLLLLMVAAAAAPVAVAVLLPLAGMSAAAVITSLPGDAL